MLQPARRQALTASSSCTFHLAQQTLDRCILHHILQDVAEAEGQVSPALLQRLVLKPQKISQLAEGIRAIAAQEEPIRRVLQRTEVAEGEHGAGA